MFGFLMSFFSSLFSGFSNGTGGNGGYKMDDNGIDTDNNDSSELDDKTDTKLNTDTFQKSSVKKQNIDSTNKDATFSKEQKQFLKLVNNFRQKNGLNPLKLDKNLCKGTQNWANTMANNHMMVHGNLSNVGRSGGYKGFVNSENIAAGQRSVKEAFNTWIHSPGHRANILNASAKDLGFAFKNGYWSMNTGRV